MKKLKEMKKKRKITLNILKKDDIFPPYLESPSLLFTLTDTSFISILSRKEQASNSVPTIFLESKYLYLS